MEKQYEIIGDIDPSIFLELKVKTSIRNVMTVIEAAFGDKLDEKQRYIVRKAVLDEFNNYKNISLALIKHILDEDTDKS